MSLSDFVGNNLPDVFGFLLNDPSLVSLALFILGFGFFTNGQVSKIFVGDSGLPIRSLCLMIATIILGLAIQGKDVSGHYLLAISPPLLMILIALISKVTMPASKYSFPLVLFAVCLLTFHGKDSSVTLQNPNRYLHWILEIENPPSLIKYQLPDNDCMQVIYGWDAGSYYHYSKNKACSKYFLVSLIQKDAISLDLYKRDLSQNPPPLVYYQTKGADIDVVEFESRVLNWSRVLESCYTQLDNGVYALDGSRVESRVCFKNSM